MSNVSTTPILPHRPYPADEERSARTTFAALGLACTTHASSLTVRVGGEIDCSTVSPLRVMLAAAAVYGYTDLRLDTSAVAFADSALLDVMDTWHRNGRTLTMQPTSRAVRFLLDVNAATGRARGAGRNGSRAAR